MYLVGNHINIYFVGTNLPRRQDIQKEYCIALQSLTTGVCGKIAEKCESKDTLNDFRQKLHANVGEALNKFIFGNVDLFNNNYMDVGKCNNSDLTLSSNDEGHYEGSGEAKFGNKIPIRYYHYTRTTIGPSTTPTRFPEVLRSKTSKILQNRLKKMSKPQFKSHAFYPSNPTSYRSRQLLTNSTATEYFHLNCRNINNMIYPGTFLPKIALCKKHANLLKKTNNMPYRNYSAYPNQPISPDIKNFLVPVKVKRNNDFDSLQNITIALTDENEINDISNYTKFGKTKVQAPLQIRDKWLLDTDADPIQLHLVDLPQQEPITSGVTRRGISFEMNTLLHLGEMGMMMYPAVFRKTI